MVPNMEKKDYLFLILVLLVIIYLFSAYYLTKKIKENPEYKDQIVQLKSEIDSLNSNLPQLMKQRVYSRTETKTFAKEVYAPQLILKCDSSEDIILSGTCAGLPTFGGDNVNAQGSYNPTNEIVPYVTEFQCVGPIYDVKGNYTILGSITCLKG